MTQQEEDDGVQSFELRPDAEETKDVNVNPDDWEVVDDDGFIYKRRKVQVRDSAPAILSKEARPQPAKSEIKLSDAATRRKKMAKLLTQKERYIAEIRSWETLLKEVQNVADDEDSEKSANIDDGDKPSKIEIPFVLDHIQALELQVTAHEEFVRRLEELPILGKKIAQQLEAGLLEGEWKFKNKLLRDVSTKTPRTAIQAFI